MARATIENNYAVEGDYLAIINKVENKEGDKNPHINVEFGILSGTTEGQEGLTHNERVFLNTDQLFVLAHACGLISKEELDHIRATKGGDFDENLLEGCYLCIGLRKEPNRNDPSKAYTKIRNRAWPINSDEAKHIPKDADVMAMLLPDGGGATAPAGQAPPAAAAAPAAQVQAPAAPAAKPSPFAGIGKGARKPAATAGAA